ncbi:ribonuclease T2 family protein [Thiofilum flexile]|uniref:ribonuclease T2 family protein n=1 Tax=Thiofilum flexile TaxID=125627 RepID=UPI0003772390|nr:hypothetical protein [Thiofilum flexile]
MRSLIIGSSGILALLMSLNVSAQVLMSGELTATKVCPATPSIRQANNPGNIQLAVGSSYTVIAKNRADNPTHYLLKITESTPNQRWVAMDCGTLAGANPSPTAPVLSSAATPNTSATAAVSGQYVLAISWQPAFCETAPGKKECKSQTTSRFDATHFTLHGLWPDRASYCNVPKDQQSKDKQGDWGALTAPALSSTLKTQLNQVMPGTQSLLENHEWIKHGTCYGAPAEQYFTDSIKVLSDINQSTVQALFANNIGKTVTSSQIRSAFDQAFGQGVGERVKIACKDDGGRRLITELTLGLKGSIVSSNLNTLALASRPVEVGCPAGIVDPVGLQ